MKFYFCFSISYVSLLNISSYGLKGIFELLEQIRIKKLEFALLSTDLYQIKD